MSSARPTRLNSNAPPVTVPPREDPYIPNKITVHKAERPLEGAIDAPPSKSYSHRALMVAGLCGGREIFVENPLRAKDIQATADAWQGLGAGVEEVDNGQGLGAGVEEVDNGLVVRGVTKPFAQGQPQKIFVKESGTSLRFLLPGLAFASGPIRVEGHNSLETRPNQMIVEPLARLGVTVSGKTDKHTVPIVVDGQGFLPVGDVTIQGDKSSQVVSAFLLWLPLASPKSKLSRILNKRHVSHVRVEGHLVSKPYVDITLDALSRWGGIEIIEDEPGVLYTIPAGQQFSPTTDRFVVNGDYSSAAFILVAACLCNGRVLVKGLQDDKQGDREIVDILKRMGAPINKTPDGVEVSGASRLQGLDLDCGHIPDLVPILCVLGAFAEGRTTLKNIAHLRHKETDRLVGPAEELKKLGVRIQCTDSSITIEKSELKMGEVSARFDHRMAMSLIVAGLAGNGVALDGALSIKKSYPRFLEDMKSLGAPIQLK
jgi:3-phosphoshikimate 1-carboxyvinyltransferase